MDFDHPEESAKTVADFAVKRPIDGVVAVDERSTVAAAHIAKRLKLPGNEPAAARAATDKSQMRALLKDARVPSADYRIVSADDDPRNVSADVLFPCVLKPTRLSASRGVIRADNVREFSAAFHRLSDLLNRPDVSEKSDGDRRIIVEEYLPGIEIAVDGLLEDGALRPLAVFDKPDPLEGPYFEETIYVTPSRLSDADQALAIECAGAAAKAMGLRQGPVHAELRINEKGPFLIELAARSIGGLCSRIVSFGNETTLEELILRNAMGTRISPFLPSAEPAGVMMLPIPHTGEFKALNGIADAVAVDGVLDCVLSVFPGKRIEALPEGGEYLGFLFARGRNPKDVETALRRAHSKLRVLYK